MRAPEEHPTLLPWYVTGTLPAARVEAIEEHLSWCGACVREAHALASLRKSLVWQGLTDHPPSEEIVALEQGCGLESRRRDLVAAHVSECGPCQDDLDATRRAHRIQRAIEAKREAEGEVDEDKAAAKAATLETAPGGARRGLTAAAAVVVVALALPVAAYLMQSTAPGPHGTTESIIFPSTVRGEGWNRELVGDGPWSIRVLLPADAPGGAYRFSVTREAVGLRRVGLEPAFADGEGNLRIRLERLSPGDGYVLLVWPAHGPVSEALEYPFHVIDAGTGPRSPWSQWSPFLVTPGWWRP